MSSRGQAGPKSTRVGMISLGCPKNRVDSEIMLGELGREGYEIVHEADGADTVIVNTCGFIDEAKEESIEAILDVARRKAEGGVGSLLVAGCMVNRYGQELREEIPEIDGFVSLDQLRDVGSLVQMGGAEAPVPSQSHMVFDHQAPRTLTTRGYAYLKVAEGCNNPCTFCAIPKWRGKFRSRTFDSLVEEAKNLAAMGVAELCLVAQDTTRYGEDLDYGKHGLTRLVERLLAETEIPWIRFLYAYPTTLDDELMRLMGQEERFCSYIDMPLQHSHPEMLKAMRRGGRAERYLRQLEKARTAASDVFLRSTFIVGFPGEKERHFRHLVDFVREARFDHLGGFVFSPEEGTPSAELPERVPRTKARRRYEELLEVQEPISLERRRRLVGRTMKVLVEGVCEETDHLLQGRHHGMAPDIDGRLLINDGAAPAGTLVDVEISEAFADDLVGHIVGPAGVAGVVPAESAELIRAAMNTRAAVDEEIVAPGR
ncbi:MAG: 30S ribosomal protein S12 methylthiotransferase RimO [Thermoanaerobaculia bacterium]|nr:30S ribosomal protein S12 methylthiotransferase RimO [Thermoanaerobaculia bacterium]